MSICAFTFQIHDPTFAEVLGLFPSLKLVADGHAFVDGLAYMTLSETLGHLYYVDWQNDSLYLVVFDAPHAISRPILLRASMAYAAGVAVTQDGELVVCGSTDHRLSVFRKDGRYDPLVGAYQGTPLNSPNDVVVKSDGSVWFTDPGYTALEIVGFEAELPNNVYRYDPATEELTVVATPAAAKLDSPNGLAFSPDETVLYVADSGATQAPGTEYSYLPGVVRAYDLTPDGRGLVMPGRSFAKPGLNGVIPDGLCVDVSGRVYMTTAAGVEVVSPHGKHLGRISTPQYAANCTFGGPDNDILFISATTSVYGIRLHTQGAVPLRRVGFPSTPPEFFGGSKMLRVRSLS